VIANEPQATALLLATCGLLLGVSVIFSRASQRTGLPIALLFLLVGMLAGSEGIGRIAFDDYQFAFRVGVLALALILFDGGLNTPNGPVGKAIDGSRRVVTESELLHWRTLSPLSGEYDVGTRGSVAGKCV
jgi:potassium/hydrogen antiporter